jgi:hypothetical protein
MAVAPMITGSKLSLPRGPTARLVEGSSRHVEFQPLPKLLGLCSWEEMAGNTSHTEEYNGRVPSEYLLMTKQFGKLDFDSNLDDPR